MTNFKEAYKIVLKGEGGYANDPDDKGGETYKGIARKHHPTWKGWETIDSYKRKSGTIKTNTIFKDTALDNLVESFYEVEFWNKMKGSLFLSQPVANIVFDMYVNSGGNAIRILQRVLNTLGKKVSTDSAMGPQTLKAVNSVDSTDLYNRYKQARKEYYTKGANEGWFNKKYLTGLLKRVDDNFPDLKKKLQSEQAD